MANRNRLSGGGGYQNRRQDAFGDYNRGFSRDAYGGGRPQGGGGGFGGVNPWHTGPPAPPQPGPLPLQASTETTIALASNLINNLLQSRNSVPSLLDINVRRDFGGYGQGYQADRRGLARMGGRGPGQLGGGQGGAGGVGGGRRPMQGRRPQRQDQPKPKNQANKQAKLKAEETVAAESIEPAEGEAKLEESEAAAGEEAMGADGKPATGKDVKTSYDGINPVFLVCHICEKKMWDGRSFDNHIKGRAHFVMMEKIRESYKMTADAMRQEQRISEMRKDRRGFQQQQRKLVYCAMCDLYVVAEGAHRRSAGHQKLKRYLHPACNTCRQEMPTRIEFEEHRLTPAHMKVLQDKHKDQEPELKTEVMQMSTLQDELALVRPFRNRQRKNQQNKEAGDETTAKTVEDGATETTEGGEAIAIKTVDSTENQTGEGEVKLAEEPVVEGPPLILEYQEGDDLSEKTRENLPKYLPDRALGTSFITDFTCKQCTLCRKLFDSEETAAVHGRTYKHFQSFLRLVHSKGNFKTKQEASKRESTADEEDGAEAEEGNRKKRKMDNGEGGAEGDEYQNGDEIGDESANNTAEQNGEDILNDSADLNEEIDQVLNAVADDAQLESEPVVEPQEEEPQTPVPEPAVTPSQKTPQLNTSQQSTPPQKTPQGTPNRRGRGRGRGRGAGRNRI